tara:strand:+ start:1766 stop:3079 length:1314 start_codon:yes stop_codon:yes gene_type:complete
MENRYNAKTIRAWTFYDWANSVYSLVISTAIFPIYYSAVTIIDESDKVDFLGRTFTNTALYDYAMAISFLFIAFISPLLSGLADYSSRKKSFLRRFCYLGAISCSALFFFDSISTLWLGLVASMTASVGFWGSQVFYNAYLPEIAHRSHQDKVSAKGYAFGYIGSSILLILCLVLIEGYEMFGFPDKGIATRFTFVLTGLWWAGFAQITFKSLPEPEERRSIHWKTLVNGYEELRKFWKSLTHDPKLKVFLAAYFFFSMGVQTVILLASVFGSKELGLESSNLIATILIIQFVGVAGAYLFSMISRKFGNIISLISTVIIWIGICFAAYIMDGNDPNVQYQFYALGGVVGLVMGGIQSQARSTYSKMLPETGEHTTYFSFYDVSEKFAIAAGMFAFGYIEEITGNMHNSALALGIFFIISLVFLLRTRQLWKASKTA